MNKEWKALIDAVPWFLAPGQVADVGDTARAGSWSPSCPDLQRQFPRLVQLLVRARVTPVRVADQQYQLFTWLEGADTRSWLTRPPAAEVPRGLFSAHVDLLGSFGGIVERVEPLESSWLLSQLEVLTLREAVHDASFIASFIREYWAFADAGVQIPIEPAEYYTIAREGNGNLTLCHRTTGAVILFAPDHAFKHVTPLAGCPKYTLYELNGAKYFVDWVNVIAEQWLEGLE